MQLKIVASLCCISKSHFKILSSENEQSILSFKSHICVTLYSNISPVASKSVQKILFKNTNSSQLSYRTNT